LSENLTTEHVTATYVLALSAIEVVTKAFKGKLFE
jgi:hypothetical protein